MHIIFSVKNYLIEDFENFLKKSGQEYDDINDICEELENDKYYHFRVKPETQYIYFGDIDGYEGTIEEFIDKKQEFLKKMYKISVNKSDIKYTENEKKGKSYHYSIPCINASSEKLKEMHLNFIEYVDCEKKYIDTSIYAGKTGHWYRCPNQTKGISKTSSGNKEEIHIIKTGTMRDFIISYIPPKSKDINKKKYLGEKEKKEKKEEKVIKQEPVKNDKKEDVKKTDTKDIVKLIYDFVNILSVNYYNEYEDWMKIGMILKHSAIKYNYDFFELFDKFSMKSLKYEKKEVRKFWDNLKHEKITITVGSLFEFAKKSNSSVYKQLVKEYFSSKIEITEKYLCEQIHEHAGKYFFFLNKDLYSFDDKCNLWYRNEPSIMKKYINDDLYDYLFTLLNDTIENETYLNEQIKVLKKYCLTNRWQKEVMEMYRTQYLTEYDTTENIKFDLNKYLFGFNNGVYDLKEGIFRKYEYSDYITTRTGYNYRASTEEERCEIHGLFNKIETDTDNRKLLWQILSSGLIGSSHQKFVIFEGSGGNGKSLTTKFMLLVLGDYGYKGNIQTLVSKQKNGANPEIANMHMKRYVVFSEPEATDKIQNSLLKDLTGGTTVNARKLYDNKTEVNIQATIVLECNEKIRLQNDSTNGEIRRIIVYPYLSTFTYNSNEVNEKERIYLAKEIDDNYMNNYKFAFLDILFKKVSEFINEDKEQFITTNTTKKYTEKYIASSYAFLNYLNETCVKTDVPTDYVKIKTLFNSFKFSDIYINSSKEERRDKFTFSKMTEFYEKNENTKKNYILRYDKVIGGKRQVMSNIMFGYKLCEIVDDSCDEIELNNPTNDNGIELNNYIDRDEIELNNPYVNDRVDMVKKEQNIDENISSKKKKAKK